MRSPHGYAVWTAPDARPVERDTATCGHCNAIIFVKPGTGSTTYLIYGLDPLAPPREVPGAGCRLCMTPVCLACEAKGTCTPFEKRLEQAEARAALGRAVLGLTC